MMYYAVLLICLVLDTCVIGDSSVFWASHLGLCERPWRKVFEHDHTGAISFGHYQALADAVTAGDVIHVVVNGIHEFKDNKTVYILQADNAIRIRDHVCIESLSGLNLFNDTEHAHHGRDTLWHVLLCSTGHLHVLSVVLGKRRVLSDRHLTASASWFLKTWAAQEQNCYLARTSGGGGEGGDSSEEEDGGGDSGPGDAGALQCGRQSSRMWPVYSNFLSGEAAGGRKISLLLEAVKRGQDVRASMRDRGYSFPMHAVHWSETKPAWVGGQSVMHVGIRHQTSRVSLRVVRPYLWMSSWSTTGRRHNSRWALEEDLSRGANQDFAALDWMTDACWRHVYTNDAFGLHVHGSREELVASVRKGHRVRVVVDNMASEADIIRVRGGHVAVQLLSQLTTLSKSQDSHHFLHDDARWNWKVVHTTGTLWQHEVLLSNHSVVSESRSSTTVSWFVDSRPWTTLLTLANRTITSGHVTDVSDAVRDGASVRVRIHHIYNDGEIFAPATNLKVRFTHTSIPVTSGQVIRYLGDEVYGDFEVRLQRELMWWMTNLDTNGVMSLHAWDTPRTAKSFDISLTPEIDWFVNL